MIYAVMPIFKCIFNSWVQTHCPPMSVPFYCIISGPHSTIALVHPLNKRSWKIIDETFNFVVLLEVYLLFWKKITWKFFLRLPRTFPRSLVEEIPNYMGGFHWLFLPASICKASFFLHIKQLFLFFFVFRKFIIFGWAGVWLFFTGIINSILNDFFHWSLFCVCLIL